MSSITNATGSLQTNTDLITNILKMVEVSESDAKRALIFYSTSGKLSGMDKEISDCGHIMDLETNCNLKHITELYTNRLIRSYMDQIFNPDNWQVVSFHNLAGRRLELSVTYANLNILELLGDLVNNLEGAARRQEHTHSVNMRVSVNFQPITGSYEVYSIDTFTKTPNRKETVHNFNGNPVVANTFLGNDDLQTYTKAQLQADVLEITRQKLPTDLAGAQFGLNAATLDVSRKDALLREIIIEDELRFIENQLFTNVCPGIIYCPSSVIN